MLNMFMLVCRDMAEQKAAQLRNHLTDTQQALQHQAQLRADREEEALRLAIDRQRLASALELERMIK